jgi:hypothetical protein
MILNFDWTTIELRGGVFLGSFGRLLHCSSEIAVASRKGNGGQEVILLEEK